MIYTKPTTNIDLYQTVTDKIIAKLEQEGQLSWRKPWNNYGLAKNYVSGKTYQGINMLLLNMFSAHDVPYYLTYKQALDLGGNVKKGAKAEQVYFFNVIFKDENGKTISQEQAQASGVKLRPIKFLKYFNVFNVADIEGIDFTIPEVKLLPHERIAKCEKIVAGYIDAPKLREQLGSQASYSPILDVINMPTLGQFKTVEGYYSTLFHEMIHSTGASKRLNREGVANFDKFGTERYSFEELIAELGCAFLCGSAGIDNESLTDNSTAYIQGWISKLKNDKQLIFKASSLAQKAVAYILGDNGEE